MLKFNQFIQALEKYAPLNLSKLMIDHGHYDNSGAIVKCSDQVEKVLFSLDLSNCSVEKAIELCVDTIVTHHPAIYNPIKNLSIDEDTAPLIKAINNGINVISMHLNLDIADEGIDQSLAKALGGDNIRVLDLVDDVHGYGREFDCGLEIDKLVDLIKENLSTDRVLVYGNGVCQTVASFCGGGASSALEQVVSGNTVADTIVTSDTAHHVVKELVERNIKLIIIPHYSAEDYGFRKFYASVKNDLEGTTQAFYYQDKRFM